ncbi:MAG: hypothetical protein DMF75_21255 [Acidobacteria bacterium]|nr:MAG: hypothetical protein DMF75_21255 [Acidobacteriota bacterium]
MRIADFGLRTNWTSQIRNPHFAIRNGKGPNAVVTTWTAAVISMTRTNKSVDYERCRRPMKAELASIALAIRN